MPRSPFTAIILAVVLIAPNAAWAQDDFRTIDNAYTTPEYSGRNAHIDNDVQRPSSLIRRGPSGRLEYRDDNPVRIGPSDAAQARAEMIRQRLAAQNEARIEREQRAQLARTKLND